MVVSQSYVRVYSISAGVVGAGSGGDALVTVLPEVRAYIDSGAEIYACRMAMDMFKLEEKDLVPQIDDILTVMDFYDKSAGSQIIFI